MPHSGPKHRIFVFSSFLVILTLAISGFAQTQPTAGVLVSDFNAGVVFYDAGGHKIASYAAGSSPEQTAVAPGQRLIFATTGNSLYTSVIDSSIGTEIARIHGLRGSFLAMDSAGTVAVVPLPNALGVFHPGNFLNEIQNPQIIATNGHVCDDAGNCDSPNNNLNLQSAVVANGKAYVATQGFNIAVFDLAQGTASYVPGTTEVASQGNSMSATSDGAYIISGRRFDANTNSSALLVFNSQTNAVIADIPLSFSARTVSVASNGTIFVAGDGQLQMFSVNEQQNTVSNLGLPISIQSNAKFSAVSADGTHLFLNDANSPGFVFVYDTAALQANPANALVSSFAAVSGIAGITAATLQTQPAAGAPQIASVSPTVIVNNQPQTLTVTGNSFPANAFVRVGNLDPLPATGSGASLSVNLPANTAAQTANVIVIDPANQVGSGILRGNAVIASPPTFQPVNQVAVTNFGDSTLSILNVGANSGSMPAVRGLQAVGSVAITPDGNQAFVENFGSPAVTAIDLTMQTLRNSIPLSPDCCFGQEDAIAVVNNAALRKEIAYGDYMTVNPGDATTQDLNVAVIDTTTNPPSLLNTMQGGLSLPFGSGPGALAATPDGHYVFVNTFENFDFLGLAGEIVVFDTTGASAPLAIPTTNVDGTAVWGFQGHIEVSPDGGYLLLSSPAGVEVFSIANPFTPVHVGTLAAQSVQGTAPVALSDYRIASGAPGRVIAFDPINSVLELFNFNPASAGFGFINGLILPAVEGARDEFGMDITPDGSLLYVALAQEDDVAVIDVNRIASGTPGALLTKIYSGLGPGQIAVRPGTPVPAPPDANTPVTVTPAPGVAVSLVGTSGGTVSVAVTNTTPFSAPAGFQIGSIPQYYELSASSSFSSAEVCLQYDPAQVPSPESALRLAHYNSQIDPTTNKAFGWQDITLPNYPDTSTHTVCGSVSSFSPFVIGIASPDFMFDTLLGNINQLQASGTPFGIVNSLRVKVINARSSKDKGNNNAADNQLNAFISDVQAQSGKYIATSTANSLVQQAQALVAKLQ